MPGEPPTIAPKPQPAKPTILPKPPPDLTAKPELPLKASDPPPIRPKSIVVPDLPSKPGVPEIPTKTADLPPKPDLPTRANDPPPIRPKSVAGPSLPPKLPPPPSGLTGNFDSPRSEETEDESVREEKVESPRKPKDEATEMNERRYKIVEEILSTERTYISALEAMVNDYFTPMLDAAETEILPNTTKEDIKAIFSNVNHLLPINKTLYESVQQRANNWHENQIVADIFLKMAPFFRIYNTYQNNYEKAVVVLTRCQMSEQFNAFVDKIDKQVKSVKKDVVALAGLLIQPVQRIPRFILLLEQLERKTPDGHPDKLNCREGMDALQRVMNYLDQDITSHEFREKFLNMGAKIKGANNLIKAHRVLIAEATLNLKSKNNAQVGGGIKSKFKGGLKEAKLQIWLFNDVLVHLKSTKNKKRTNVSSTEYTWPLQLVWLKDNPDLDATDPKMPYTFMLVGPCKTYTLRFPDLNEKKNWYSKIKTTVDKQLTEEIAPDDINRFGTYKFPDKYGSEYEGWWMFGRIHGQGTYRIFGNRYSGEWEYNRKCGSGTFQSVTGEIYHGEWKDDRPHGYGQIQFSNGDRYDGEWEDGMRKGKGAHYYNTGDRYVGEWNDGVPSGSGSYCTTSGITYGGSWHLGKAHGYGCLIMPNGRRYEGEFRSGLKWGEGKLDFANGDFYIGQWVQDRFHGFGIYHCAIDGVYEGMFVNGLKEGRGKMRFRNGDVYDGEWKRGLFHERGVLISPVGGIERYEGGWDNGKYHGKGTMFYRNGSKYEGQFKDGKHHGTGTFVSANTVIYDGKWVEGRREGKASIAVGPVNYTSNCMNSMMGKREASFLVVPDVPTILLDL